MAITFAVVGTIVAEFVGSDHGLGYLLVLARGNLDTVTVFAAILWLIAIGFLFYFAVELAERTCLRGRGAHRRRELGAGLNEIDMAVTPASPLEFPDSPFARIMRQPLLLGMFLPIQSGGWSPSSLPRSTSWEFDYNARLTQRAEALGFDLAFGLAQWMGKGGTGGAIRFREQSLDPFITASSLAVITQRIILISTIHVLYGPWHPLYLAKLGATVDHISHGRWGLNVVTGFVPSEARMFGNEQIEHDQRYAMADEFIELMKALWASRNNLSRDGRYWRLIDAFVTPKPSFGRPILVNATGSPAGIGYAAKHSDLVFITSPGGGFVDAAIAALPGTTRRSKPRRRSLAGRYAQSSIR